MFLRIDIALDRKIDPGELFDWEFLAKNGVGLWPDPLKEDFEKAVLLLKDEKRLKDAFALYGYDTNTDLKTIITQFQRHFDQEVFKNVNEIGVANEKTVARLCSLIRMSERPKA